MTGGGPSVSPPTAEARRRVFLLYPKHRRRQKEAAPDEAECRNVKGSMKPQEVSDSSKGSFSPNSCIILTES